MEMKEINTSINIKASPEKVWSILTDFTEYNKWNPFIISVTGSAVLNSRLEIILSPPDANTMKFKPTLTDVKEREKLEWLGRVLMPGIFDGRHAFQIIDNKDGTVTFVQKEQFTGLLVPFLAKSLDDNTKRGFILMNEKLKEICEQT